MANRRSTVQFTDVTEPLLKQLEDSGFDIRSCVNGALVVFSNLSGDEQKEAITKANGSGLEPLKGPEDEFREKVSQICQELGVLRAEKKSRRRANPPKP